MQVLHASHRLSAGLPSPTLTNPDMILPFDNPSSFHETSASTPRRPHQLPSPPMNQEELAQSGSMENRNRLKHAGQSLSPFRNGVLSRNDGSTRARSNSDRGNGRIRYENSRLSYRPSGEGPITPFTASRLDYENGGMDRLAESLVQDDDLVHHTYKTPSILEEDENDPESHAALTKRAEEILANAKKRLTNMEGNLTRARSTLNSRPSSSMSSFAEHEPASLYTISKDQRYHGGFSPLKHRQASSSLKADRQGHARVVSETSVPSSLQTPQAQSNGQDHDARASPESHGIDPAGKDHSSEPTRNWFWNGLTRTTSLANKRPNGLQPLNEDGPAPDSFERHGILEEAEEEEDRDRIQGVETRREYHEQRIAAASDPSVQHSPTSGLTRAKSTTQMRDLREQMSDLKGKIVTLRHRAREDSLRRRSLQSLRTPSPLNAAQQDYSGVPLAEGQNRGTGLGLVGITEPAPEISPSKEEGPRECSAPALATAEPLENGHNHDEAKKDLDIGLSEQPASQAQVSAVTLPIKSEPTATESPLQKEDLHSSLQQEPNTLPKEPDFGNDEMEAVAQESEVSEEFQELEDSIDGDQEYHEPVGERHEDRADAFDYEHFFLHSSMGDYGRNRSSTHSSNYSVETEKPAANMDNEEENGTGTESPGKHGRQNSTGSISTVNTFATATEGMEDEEEQDWIPRQTMAGSWHVEPSKVPEHKHKSKSSHSSPKSKDPKRNTSVRHHHKESTEANGIPPTTGPPDILTYLASLTSARTREPAKPFRLSDSDRALAERAIKSLANVCKDLEGLSTEGGKYEARLCRRKIDSARRHLDGEVNGEAF